MNFGVAPGGSKVSGSFSHEVSFSQSHEYSESKTETRSQTIDFDIPEDTKADVSIVSRTFEIQRSYEGPVTVDGIVVATYGSGENAGVRRFNLNQLLSEDERSFNIKGVYSTLDSLLQPIDIIDIGC